MPCPHCRVCATQPFAPEPKRRAIPLWPSRWLGDPGMVPRSIEIGTLGDSGKANILRVVTATGAVLHLDDTDGSATHILWHELGGHHDGYRSIIDPAMLATYRKVNTLFVSTAAPEVETGRLGDKETRSLGVTILAILAALWAAFRMILITTEP